MIKFCKNCQCETERHLVDRKCKVCVKARSAAYYSANTSKIKSAVADYKSNNLDKYSAYNKARYAADPEASKASSSAWQRKHKDISNARKIAWKKTNPEKAKLSANSWAINNPESRKLAQHTRRARISLAGGYLSKGIEKRLFDLQKGKCPCCKQPLGENYHLDHVMPIALGGPNIDSNVQLLRQRCNQQKQAKHPVDFMQSRGFLL